MQIATSGPIQYPSSLIIQLLLRLFNNTVFIIKKIFNEAILSYFI